MITKKILLFFLFIQLSALLQAQNQSHMVSPDGQLVFVFGINKGKPAYTVKYKNWNLINTSTIGLSFISNDYFGNNIELGKVSITEGVDDYTLPAGKTSRVQDNYREASIPLYELVGKKRLVIWRVRIFNDGLAFRYEFPDQKDWPEISLTDEQTTFNLAGNPMARVAFLENFTTSHEHRYALLPLNEIRNDTLMDMPALFEFPGRVYMAITEANLVNYAGMSLIKKHGILCSQLSPLPGQLDIKVKSVLPHQTPWRVLLISDRIGALIESNMLTSLCKPSGITDLSWLKPGKATFHWWNGDIMPDTTFEAGVNFNFNKYYIDFCSRNGLAYHTIIGYRGVPWYTNDGIEYQPGPHTDILKPRPGLDIEGICNYAKSKGVGIRVWVHWKALYPKLDTAFALFEKWGIKGMMVDFMDRDDQEMVDIQEKILQKAVVHHLEIQFHGAYKPTGLSRTYPNESTREGTLNYENNKWGNLITPDDDINIPFTRLLAGPTDYHLGGFRAMPASTFRQQFTRPHMLATRCHMLAMYIILENHLSMVCDYPQAYEQQDGFEFIKTVPVVWDQTVVPDAVAGQWVSIARRKGKDWYIGIISNSKPRKVNIPLNFLPVADFMTTMYKDAVDAALNPNKLVKVSKLVHTPGNISIDLASGGGAVIILRGK